MHTEVTLSRSFAAQLNYPGTTEATRAAIQASIERVASIPAEIRARLTFRQADVLALVLEGHPNQQIGDQLGISVHTVISLRKAIVALQSPADGTIHWRFFPPTPPTRGGGAIRRRDLRPDDPVQAGEHEG